MQPLVDRVFALLNPLEDSQFPPTPILEPRTLSGGFPCRAGPRVDRRHCHPPGCFFLSTSQFLTALRADETARSRGLHFVGRNPSISPLLVAPCDPQEDLISSQNQRIDGAPHALKVGTAWLPVAIPWMRY